MEALASDDEIEKNFHYQMPEDLRKRFAKTEDVSFDVKKTYVTVTRQGERPKVALERSVDQHTSMICENTDDFFDALELIDLLDQDVEYRVKQYSYCISKNTDNYLKWLQDDYKRKLTLAVRRHYGYS